MSEDDDPQTKLALVDIGIHQTRGAELLDACESIARNHGWARSAAELDAIFEKEGRPVSEGVLRSALKSRERNYARMEWTPYFASLSDEPAQVLAIAAGKSLAPNLKLKPEDELALLQDRLVREASTAGARLVASVGGRRR